MIKTVALGHQTARQKMKLFLVEAFMFFPGVGPKTIVLAAFAAVLTLAAAVQASTLPPYKFSGIVITRNNSNEGQNPGQRQKDKSKDSKPPEILTYDQTDAAAKAKRRRTSTSASADVDGSIDRYFDSIKNNYPELIAFLRQMPKGADLHNHLSGAIYAEDFIRWSADAGDCLNTDAMTVRAPSVKSSCNSGEVPIRNALYDSDLYGRILRAWSMLNWQLSGESGHDHFFATFGKFGGVSSAPGEMLASAMRLAAQDNVMYLELMNSPNSGGFRSGSRNLPWTTDFAQMRQQMLASMGPALDEAKRQIDDAESGARRILKCGSPGEEPACRVTVRYVYQSLRGAAPQDVFALFLAGMELQTRDQRMVGVNLVQPEDLYVSMHDFHQQMAMLDYLHSVYPSAHIALHAGELTAGLVAPEGLRDHIRGSIEQGHAERIGHGVDVMYEDKPFDLLKELARRNILVEICLTSNKTILGVAGEAHPLSAYIKAGVPVALSTDDEGVSRSSMTNEFFEAVTEQHLGYSELKKMARTGLDHAFLPGASLWKEIGKMKVADCQKDEADSSHTLSSECAAFLRGSQKAELEWALEHQFSTFEAGVKSGLH